MALAAGCGMLLARASLCAFGGAARSATGIAAAPALATAFAFTASLLTPGFRMLFRRASTRAA